MKDQLKEHSACHCSSTLERPRYFPRKLITDAEMSLEQEYFLQRWRLHNRMLHGWGVVCGAKVCLVLEPAGSEEPLADCGEAEGEVRYKRWKVVVMPGYILGPYGDEILIDCPREVDLRTRGVQSKAGDPCGQIVDPWCNEVPTEHESGPLYVAVKYKQAKTRPVRVQPTGCGCDDTQCEYSHWRDGYEIGILKECPVSHIPGNGSVEVGPVPACPRCEESPWVVLAKVVHDAGNVESIDNCECRRLVNTFGSFWSRCTEEPLIQPQVTCVNSSPPSVLPNSQGQLTIEGKHLSNIDNVRLGTEVTVDTVNATGGSSVNVSFTVSINAAAGPRDLEIEFEDGRIIRWPQAIQVAQQTTEQVKAGPSKAPKGKKSKPRRS